MKMLLPQTLASKLNVLHKNLVSMHIIGKIKKTLWNIEINIYKP